MKSPTSGAALVQPNATVDPNITRVNPGDAIPGTPIEIDGTAFDNVQEVTFGGTPAGFKPVSPTEVIANVPNLSPGSAPVQVITTLDNGRSAASNMYPFTVDGYQFNEPDEFDPKKGIVGDAVTIHGKHLGSVNMVFFNMIQAAQPSTGASQRIGAVVPPGATTGPITLKGPLGSVTSQQNFVVIQTPEPKSVSPQSGPVGTKLTITGKHLGDTTSVTYVQNGASYNDPNFKNKDEHTLKTTIPSGLNAGAATIMVQNRAGAGSIPFSVTG